MKRLFFARCLVYGSLAACLGTLAWVGRGDDGRHKEPMPGLAVRRHIALADSNAPADWHRGVPALEKRVDMHLSGATLAQSVARFAHLTGLNLACFDPDGAGRLSLHVTGIPLWQAMDALARACGGSWRRDGNLYTLRLDRAPSPRSVASLPIAALAA